MCDYEACHCLVPSKLYIFWQSFKRLDESLHLTMAHLGRGTEENLSASSHLPKLQDLPQGTLTSPHYQVRVHGLWADPDITWLSPNRKALASEERIQKHRLCTKRKSEQTIMKSIRTHAVLVVAAAGGLRDRWRKEGMRQGIKGSDSLSNQSLQIETRQYIQVQVTDRKPFEWICYCSVLGKKAVYKDLIITTSKAP